MAKQKPLQKVREISNAIKERFYFTDNFADTAIIKGKQTGFNPMHLLTVLTDMVNGRMLYKGDYGLGKTTLPKTYTSLSRGIPMEVVQLATQHGHPEVSKFDLVGTPDLGKLNEGDERVIWAISHMFNLPEIFDELPRIPEGKQGIILSGVEEGVWKLGNNYMFKNGKFGGNPFFATANFIDDGNSEVIPPVLDRFTVVAYADPQHFMQNHAAMEALKEGRGKELYLGNTSAMKQLVDLIQESVDSDEIVQEVREIPEEMRKQFAKQLKEKGLPAPLTVEERVQLLDEVRSMPNAKGKDDPAYFMHALLIEANTSRKYGAKRSEDPPAQEGALSSEIRDKQSIGSNLVYPISPRVWRIMDYARALAYFAGENEVNVGHVKAVLPYNLARLTFADDFKQTVESSHRGEATQIACGRKLIDNFAESYDKEGEEYRNAMALRYQFENTPDGKDEDGNTKWRPATFEEKKNVFEKALKKFSAQITQGKDDSHDITGVENTTVYQQLLDMKREIDCEGRSL